MKYQRLAGGGTLLGVALLLFSCSRSPTSAGPPAGSAAGAAASSAAPLHADAAGIDWYRGEVSDAFSAARTAHKPILLYWGAIWCPPCQELKSTVFSRLDFIARSRLFLPVYLDGDEAGAQKWGEKFHVSGYPTLVVLNAEGRELMRIAGGMDLNQYATVLDTALADLQPADALLSPLTAGSSMSTPTTMRPRTPGWRGTLTLPRHIVRSKRSSSARACRSLRPITPPRLRPTRSRATSRRALRCAGISQQSIGCSRTSVSRCRWPMRCSTSMRSSSAP